MKLDQMNKLLLYLTNKKKIYENYYLGEEYLLYR